MLKSPNWNLRQVLVAHSEFPRWKPRGFTLVELLAVISIIVIMFGLAVPAINGIKNASDVSKAVYDVAGLLDQARAYAMGSNTYVYVGLEEVDVSASDSVVPQTAGTGRLAIGVMASIDGTSPASGSDLVPSNLTPILKIQRFDNLHLADFSNSSAASGPMSKRNPVTKEDSLANASTNAKTGVNWPIGSAKPQYTFYKIIRFSPQGVATLQGSAALPSYLEIGLQQTKGSHAPDVPTDIGTTNLAAIQIDGIIGSNRIFRP